METYRHATYRYSTGNGLNPIVDVPSLAHEVASFKMEPLLHNLIESEILVNLKREADRVSMQTEDGMRQIKNLRYDPGLAANLKILKRRVELIRHLMTNYPLEHILREDLEKLYDLYAKNSPGMDPIIARAVAYNKNAKELKPYITTAKRVRKGYDIFDQFGRKLDRADKTLYKNSEARKDLSGFSGSLASNPVKFVVLAVIIMLALNLLR